MNNVQQMQFGNVYPNFNSEDNSISVIHKVFHFEEKQI